MKKCQTLKQPMIGFATAKDILEDSFRSGIWEGVPHGEPLGGNGSTGASPSQRVFG